MCQIPCLHHFFFTNIYDKQAFLSSVTFIDLSVMYVIYIQSSLTLNYIKYITLILATSEHSQGQYISSHIKKFGSCDGWVNALFQELYQVYFSAGAYLDQTGRLSTPSIRENLVVTLIINI